MIVHSQQAMKLQLPPLPRMLRAALATTVLLSAGLTGLVRAEERGLKRIYDFVVDTNGVSDSGWKLYAPAQKNKILLVSPANDQYLLLNVADRSVRPVDRSLSKSNADGTVDVLAGGVSSTRIIPIVQKESAVSFDMDGRTLTLKPRPPLLGEHSLSDLVSDRPNFGEGIQKYQPEAPAVSFLKGYRTPTQIEIFFGSWCPVCEAWVPKLLKSLNQAGNSKIEFTLIGVARDYPELAKSKGIRGLPTFIIRQNGVEVGRIVGAPQTGTVEAALVDVLRSKQASAPIDQGRTGKLPVKATLPAPKAAAKGTSGKLPAGASLPAPKPAAIKASAAVSSSAVRP